MAIDASAPRADAADAGQRDRARGRGERAGRRLAQQLRRAGARRAAGGRRGPRVRRAAPLQRHAAVEHGADLRRRWPFPTPSRSCCIRSAKLATPNWTVESVDRARPALGLAARRQAHARPGGRRRLRHADRHAHGVARSSTAKSPRPRPFRCRLADAPPSSSRRSTCRTASAAARSASIRPTPFRTTMATCLRSSDPIRCACCSSTPPPTARSPRYFGDALGSAAESAFALQSVSVEQAVNLLAVEVRLRRPVESLRSAGVVREPPAWIRAGRRERAGGARHLRCAAAAACRSSARRFRAYTTTRASRPLAAIGFCRWVTPIGRTPRSGRPAVCLA